MAVKERAQNPILSDTLNLRLITYNSNNLADVEEVKKVEIYFLDPNNVTADNPDGRRLVHEFEGDEVTSTDTGHLLLQVDLDLPCYTIGRYLDVWTITTRDTQPDSTIQQCFQVYADLWYTTPIPVVYDFDFHFRPNQLRQGSKQYLLIEIVPNVPRSKDLQRYYENLAIVSDLKITIEQHCGDCLPQEKDLRLVVEEESVDFRDKRFGYYQLDTEDLDCGIYNVWFRLDFGGNRYISHKMQLQIFE